MTRDEAIEWLIEQAEGLISESGSTEANRLRGLLAEAKAALAEPVAAAKCSKCGAAMATLCADCFGDDEVCAQDIVRRAQAVLDDPQIRPRLLALAGAAESEMIGADLSDWFCHFFNHGRCQHQAADASLDCTEPAVLCEAHGGHDGCAVEVMRLQARIAEPVDVTTFVNEGRRMERDEIARALDLASQGLEPSVAFIYRFLAGRVRDGSIREWLPKEGE